MSDWWEIKPPPNYVKPIPKIKWEMDFFGDGSVVFRFEGEKSWWPRLWCKLLFGTKWKKFK
jgi:hypothetical protein